MTYHFTETAPYEAGFSDIFHTEVVPILERHEALRKTYMRKALTGVGASSAVSVGGFGAGFNYDSTLGLFVGGAGALTGFGAKAYYDHKWKGGLGSEVLPILCEFLGGIDYGQQPVQLHEFLRLGVIPSYDSSTLEDAVSGSHDGLAWAMTEATLKSRSRDSKGRTRTTTVFRGLLFTVEIVGPAPRIFFGKDRGGLGNWFSETFSSSRHGLEKMEIDNPAFEAVYETYSSDPVAARRYIDDRLTSGLLDIARTETAKRFITCALDGDTLYLALPRRGDFLGLGSLFRPLTSVEADLHEAFTDLTLPPRLIDRLRNG